MHASEFDFDVITGPSIPEAPPAKPDDATADDATPAGAAATPHLRHPG